MRLYDVFYPASRSFDRKVPWDYLEKLASQGKKYNGVLAVNCDSPRERFVLKDSEWIDAPKSPEER